MKSTNAIRVSAAMIAASFVLSSAPLSLADDPPPEKCHVLVYFDGAADVEDIYKDALLGLAENSGLAVEMTADPGAFTAALDGGQYAVVFAISEDIKQLRSWVQERHEVPTLVTVGPDGMGSYEMTVVYYSCFGEPVVPPGWQDGKAVVGPGWLEDILEKIKDWVEKARIWAGRKVQEIGQAIEDLEGEIEVEATIHVGEPTGSVWIEVTIRGDKKAVGAAVKKFGKIVECK